jgi:hypothetical protein
MDEGLSQSRFAGNSPTDHGAPECRRCGTRQSEGSAMSDMDILRREFPDFDPATLPAIPEGFTCTAWHNDTCPTWAEGQSADEPKAGDMMLAIDYADPTLREFPNCDRFSISLYSDNGIAYPFVASSDWRNIETAIQFVKHVRELGLGFHADTRGRDYVGPGDFGRFFTDEQADQYDENVGDMAEITDPHEAAIAIWKAMGLVND